MIQKLSIYSVDIYPTIIQGINNRLVAELILQNHKVGNLSLYKDEEDRANNEEDSTLPESEETKKLTELIYDRVCDIVEEHYPNKRFDIGFENVTDGKNNIWSHVTFPNECTIYHNHHTDNDTSFLNLSAVYYVKTNPKCGKIFFNPQGFTSKLFPVQPQDGMLIIFPSWLYHFTGRNLSDEVRISVAANFFIRESEN